MLGICHIDIGNDVHDAAVGLLGQALILAAVARFHVKDRDVQPLCRDGGKAGIGVAEDRKRVGLNLRHQLIGAADDVPHRLAEIIPHSVHIHLGIAELQILEKHAV